MTSNCPVMGKADTIFFEIGAFSIFLLLVTKTSHAILSFSSTNKKYMTQHSLVLSQVQNIAS